MKMSGGSKNSFSSLQTECLDTEGLVPVLATEGRTGGAWPVDHGQLECGGSEVGQGDTPGTGQNQMLGSVSWLSLLHRVSGIFLGSPKLCCILGWVSVCVKHPLGLAWPWAGGTGSAHPACATLPPLLLVQLPRKLFQQPPEEEIVISWSSCLVRQPGGQQWMGTAEEGSGATSGHKIIWFG